LGLLGNMKMHWHRLRDTKILSLHSVKVRTGIEDVPKSVRSALFKGTYEKFECDLVKQHVTAGAKILEIGTGIGLVSLVATRLSGQGNVLSYEANPKMEATIRANYLLNGFEPNLRMKALTADGRELTFFQDQNILSSSLHERDIKSTTITVPSVAINDVLKETAPSVILMDVEGAEVELLEIADLSNVKVMIIEMHPHIVGHDVIDGLLESLNAQGFTPAEQQHKTYLFTR
jgi:FkbM family methyltransferase